MTVTAPKDRTRRPLVDGEIDRARCSGNERDDGRLVALPDDTQGPVPSLEAQVLDVGRAGLTHPEAVEPEKHRQSGVSSVEALCGEEEGTKLGAVEPSGIPGMDFGRRTYCAGLAAMRPSMWAKR